MARNDRGRCMNEYEIFTAALDRTVEDRTAFVDAACGGDESLRRRIGCLLAMHERPSAVFDQSPQAVLSEPVTMEGLVIAGRYSLVERIGEGAMGEVWLARQTEPVLRTVAVKLIKSGLDSQSVFARFEQERQSLAVMDHPNIARVFDGGLTSEGQPYFAMERVDGPPLTTYCERRGLPLRLRLELMIPVAMAVQHAHQKGLIHRDLKPANILVAEVDGHAVPKVIDFGVAKAVDARREATTQVGVVIGTLEYMAPEQASGGDIDTRADIYALGVILYELLTGARPIEVGTIPVLEALQKLREVEPPKPSDRAADPRLRGDLDWILLRCLEKDRERRYATAGALARDLERYLADEPVEARPPTAAYRVRKFIRRHRVGVAAGGVGAAAVLAGIGAATYGLVQAREARERETQRADAEVRERRRADAEKETALRFRDQALKALRAATVDDVENLIGTRTTFSRGERAYLDAIARRWQTFAAEMNAHPETRRDQAEGLMHVAMIWKRLGRGPESLGQYEACLALWDQLRAEHPADPELQAFWARTQGNIAALRLESGDAARAEADFRAAIVVHAALVAAHPANLDYRSDLARARGNRGVALLDLGKPDEALTELQVSRDERAALVRQQPTATGQYELGISHRDLGGLHAAQGREGEARAEFTAARDVLVDLVARTGETLHQNELARVHNHIGLLFGALKRFEDSGREFDDALRLQARMASQYPAVPRYAIDAGGTCCNHGHVLREGGRAVESLLHFDAAIVRLAAVVAAHPSLDVAKAYLRNSRYGRALALTILGRASEADAEWDRLLETLSESEQPRYELLRVPVLLDAGRVADAVAVLDRIRSRAWPLADVVDLAALYAKAGRAEPAMALLRKAVAANYDDTTRLKTDERFRDLRNREDFQALLNEMAKRKP